MKPHQKQICAVYFCGRKVGKPFKNSINIQDMQQLLKTKYGHNNDLKNNQQLGNCHIQKLCNAYIFLYIYIFFITAVFIQGKLYFPI